MEAQTTSSLKLHRLFRIYDPEVVAVLTILIGAFHGLLGITVYFIYTRLPGLFVCPFLAGMVQATVGTLAMLCERTPNRNLLRNCLFLGVTGLLVSFSAVVVYSCGVKDLDSLHVCDLGISECPDQLFIKLWKSVVVGALLYNISAMILQGFLTFSALKSLKTA